MSGFMLMEETVSATLSTDVWMVQVFRPALRVMAWSWRGPGEKADVLVHPGSEHMANSKSSGLMSMDDMSSALSLSLRVVLVLLVLSDPGLLGGLGGLLLSSRQKRDEEFRLHVGTAGGVGRCARGSGCRGERSEREGPGGAGLGPGCGRQEVLSTQARMGCIVSTGSREILGGTFIL